MIINLLFCLFQFYSILHFSKYFIHYLKFLFIKLVKDIYIHQIIQFNLFYLFKYKVHALLNMQ
jgi:hypothetical protein